jgi:hypothetical protein
MMIQVWTQEEDHDFMIQVWALNEEITIEVRAQEEDHDVMSQVWALSKEIAIQVSALMTVKDDANFGWIVSVCCNFVQHFPDHEREEKQKILQKKQTYVCRQQNVQMNMKLSSHHRRGANLQAFVFG